MDGSGNLEQDASGYGEGRRRAGRLPACSRGLFRAAAALPGLADGLRAELTVSGGGTSPRIAGGNWLRVADRSFGPAPMTRSAPCTGVRPERALRLPSQVMRLPPAWALSFRPGFILHAVLLRLVECGGASVARPVWDIDAEGFGTAVPAGPLAGRPYGLVAFSTPLAPEDRTDRVTGGVGTTYALFDGLAPADRLQELFRAGGGSVQPGSLSEQTSKASGSLLTWSIGWRRAGSRIGMRFGRLAT